MKTISVDMKRVWRLAALLSLVLLGYSAFHRTSAQTVPFDTGQTSVAGTTTRIVGANSARTGLLLTNPGTVGVYIGVAGVATTTGAFLPGGGSISIPTRAEVYGISSGASQNITFLETYERLP